MTSAGVLAAPADCVAKQETDDEESPAGVNSGQGTERGTEGARVAEHAFKQETDDEGEGEERVGGRASKRETGDEAENSVGFEQETGDEGGERERDRASQRETDGQILDTGGDRGRKRRRIASGTARANTAEANGDPSGAAIDKSTKQKDKSRQLIATDISYLGSSLAESGNWDVKQSSFQSSDLLPLDLVHFDEKERRYRVQAGSAITEDDVIIQAMVVFSLYRMERGWGKGRSNKALSIWSGTPAKDSDEMFPLENLWEEEIRQKIGDKRLGKTTLGHFDNFDNFPRFYATSKGRWARRSTSYIGQVHVFAEQAAIQLALHLHRHCPASTHCWHLSSFTTAFTGTMTRCTRWRGTCCARHEGRASASPRRPWTRWREKLAVTR